jgi:4-aminobutyrate aminotransferase-like enzyme
MTIVRINNSFDIERIFIRLIEKGIFVGYAKVHNFIHLYPPMTISNKETNYLCQSLKQTLAED